MADEETWRFEMSKDSVNLACASCGTRLVMPNGGKTPDKCTKCGMAGWIVDEGTVVDSWGPRGQR